MDGGLQILTNLGKFCDELKRKKGRTKEMERGKGEEQSAGGRRVYIGRPLVPVRGTNWY